MTSLAAGEIIEKGCLSSNGLDQTVCSIPSNRYQALMASSETMRVQGDYVTGVVFARQAAAAAVDMGDAAAEAKALHQIANQLIRTGDEEEAAKSCERAIQLLEAIGDEAGLSETLNLLALSYINLGLNDEALAAVTRSLTIAQALGDAKLLYWAYNRTGIAHGSVGDPTQADIFLHFALPLADALGDEEKFCLLNNLAYNAIPLVRHQRAQGRPAQAEQTLREALRHGHGALALAEAARHPYREAISLGNLGQLLALDAEFARAFSVLEQSRILAARHDYLSLAVAAVHGMASINLMRGEWDAAVERLHLVLTLALETSEKPILAQAHRQLSEAHEALGAWALALTHFQQFHGLEQALRSSIAETRARIQTNAFELANSKIETERARLELELYKTRSTSLEAEKLKLQIHAEELGRHAYQDGLTGLWNRRYVDTSLPSLLALAKTGDTTLCIAIGDVDHFKSINDRFGHAIGDEVLRVLGRLLTEGHRASEISARIGGEEFLLVFEAPFQRAAEICTRLLNSIAGYDWRSIHRDLSVTMSFGLVDSRAADDANALILEADQQLYRAKRDGRNRVRAAAAE